MRGAGTSIAGNAVGTGVVLDTSRHLTRVLEVDAEARTATVEPGVVQAALQKAAQPHGLRFGPDPSTHNRCTVGGMIGNNACGSRALGYGRTVGQRRRPRRRHRHRGTAAPGRRPSPSGGALAGLRDLVAGDLATIRTELRPVRPAGLRLLAGAPAARARLRRRPGAGRQRGHARGRRWGDRPPGRRRPAPGAGRARLPHDGRRRRRDAGPAAARAPRRLRGPRRPDRAAAARRPGGGRAGPAPRRRLAVRRARRRDRAEVTAAARGGRRLRGAGLLVVTDAGEAAALWRIREDGAGLAARSQRRPPGARRLGGRRRPAGAPGRLPARLRRAARPSTGCRACPTGTSATAACTSGSTSRSAPTAGRAAYRVVRRGRRAAGRRATAARCRASTATAGPAASCCRSCTPPPRSACSRGSRPCSTPTTLLNPGVLVDPAPLDADLRAGGRAAPPRAASRWPSGTTAATSPPPCTAAPASASAAPTCRRRSCARRTRPPGRRRTPPAAGPGCCRRCSRPAGRCRAGAPRRCTTRSTSACPARAAARDCPTGVDMATYKAEVLHQSYRRRPRPAAALHARPAAPLGRRRRPGPAGGERGPGVAPRRPAGQGGRPASTSAARCRRSPGRPFRRQWADRPVPAGDGARRWRCGWTPSPTPSPRRSRTPRSGCSRPPGYRVQLPGADTCCGLTWITTGQLDAARTILGRTVATLAPLVDAGHPDRRAGAVLHRGAARRRRRAARRAATPNAGARHPDPGRAAHEHARAGSRRPGRARGRRPAALPPRLGARLGRRRRAAAAGRRHGSPGSAAAAAWPATSAWSSGHYDVSVAVAEQHLLPAVRDAGPDAVVLADGFSCRTQLDRPGRPQRPAPGRAAGGAAALIRRRAPPAGPGRSEHGRCERRAIRA